VINNSNQEWAVGATVKVGFMAGLIVIARIPTPGDYAPDAYILGRGNKLYSFVPHKGLTVIAPEEARAKIVKARRQAEVAAEQAARVALSFVTAAEVRAELLVVG